MTPPLISPEEVYLSPLATATLVGRKSELARIADALGDSPRRYVIYITGQGGIGKTRLLQHILQNPPEGLAFRVATRPVDMYHTINHTIEGLLQSIQEAVSPDGSGFGRYREERERWRRAPREEIAARQEHRERMVQAFLKDWDDMAQTTRVLIALDTMERLFLQDDPVARRLGISVGAPLVYGWLLEEFLPHLQNTVIILAGRPVPFSVEDSLKAVGEFLSISLSGLTLEETLEYFQALIPLLQKSPEPRDQRAAEILSRWDNEIRQMFFYGLRDDGTVRPIFLALAIDYLTISGRPFPLGRSLSELQNLSREQRADLQNALLRGVEEAIRTALHPTERIVEALGWLHRGADEALLGQITGLSGSALVAACDRVRRLSFVKIRPADQRLFLHDEMYALLRDPREGIPDTVFRPVQKHYKTLINQIKENILQLYRAQPGFPPTDQMALEANRLQETIVEDLHYKLHRNPREGFDQYFVYAEEALAVGDETLDMQLRAELMDFLREQDPLGEAEAIGNLSLADIQADAAVRWVKRQIVAGRYDQALSLVHKLRSVEQGLVAASGVLTQAELDIAEATVHLYQGNLQEAERRLSEARQRLEGLAISEEVRIRRNAILGRLYNHWGYLRRVQGQFIAAEEMYWKALPYWRAVNMEAEQANTLTNLAFVLALRGEFDAARRHAQDALALRRGLGLASAVALSLNTLAQIEIYAGEHWAAEEWARQALAVAQKVGFLRGEGLASLSLAACYRYLSEPPCPAASRKDWLEKSLQCSHRAREIFSQHPLEPERLGTAYYEEAIAHREFCRPPLIEGVNVKEHARLSEASFRQAMKISEEYGLWALYLDAAMGLAWLYHYTGADKKLRSHQANLEKLIQKRFAHYRVIPNAPPVIRDDTILAVFSQMARLHILRGVRALDHFDPAQESQQEPPYPSLRQAAREFALALEYNTLVAENFRDLRRALNLIHERLKGLNIPELRAFYDAVASMADEFPWKSRKEEWRFWKELVKHFGPYDELRQLAL